MKWIGKILSSLFAFFVFTILGSILLVIITMGVLKLEIYNLGYWIASGSLLTGFFGAIWAGRRPGHFWDLFLGVFSGFN